MKLCIPHPLEVRGKRITDVGGVAGKEAYTFQAINFISQHQTFLLIFGLHSIFVCFPSVCQLVMSEMHSLFPATVPD
jgi:hypothetical protein